MSPIDRVPLYYIDNHMELVDSLGADSAKLFEEAGITAREIDAGEDATISLEQFTFVLRRSIELTGEPAIGLLLGSRMTITNHGSLGLAAMSSASVAEAADLIGRYIQVRTPLIDIEFSEDSSGIALRIIETKVPSEVKVVFLETVMSALIGALRFIAGGRCYSKLIRCSYSEPEYSSLYEGIFLCPAKFDQPYMELIFEPEQLKVALPNYDKTTKSKAVEQCEREILEVPNDVAMQIQRRLAANRGPFPSLERIAEELNMTARTLRRRLAEAGTCFQDILDGVRRDIAVDYLKNTRLSVSEIAFFLGYNDPSNFGRAFKKWCGVSPSQFRGKDK